MIKKGDIITIAGGHGGSIGASGTHNGVTYKEEVLTEKLALRLTTMLKENGYKSYDCTPSGKFSNATAQMSAEVTAANKYNAKLHLCIHFNCSDNPKAYGVESLIHAKGGQAEKYAPVITKAVSDLGFYNRGVRVAKDYLGYDLYVCKNTNAPCVLLEVCFISNASDIKKYDQEKTAKALYRAITGQDYKEPSKPTTPAPSKTTYYRVVADGTTIGSYSVYSNVVAEVEKAIKNNKSKIELIRVVK